MSILRDNIKHLLTIHSDMKDVISNDPKMSELEQFGEKMGYEMATLIQFNINALQLPWNNIKFIFLDVDGVMTEGGMFYTEDKKEFKRFDTKDGMAIKTAMKHGYQFGIISSGINREIIQHRADMFGIKHVYVGTEPKLNIAKHWLNEMGLSWDQIGYIGDDINDLVMFNKVAIAACPSDATIPNKEASQFVLQSQGGKGCVREFCRYLPDLKSVL